jgi:hypothetical protein
MMQMPAVVRGRRVWWIVGLAVLSIGVALPAVKAAVPSGATAPQWVLLKITAAKPTQFTIRQYAPSVERDGDGPMLYGFGMGGNTNPGGVDNEVDYSYLSVNHLDNADLSITTSKNAGGVNRTVAPRTSVTLLSRSDGGTFDYRLTPPGSLYLLAFVTNARFTDSPIDVIGDDVVVETMQGTGTGVMSAADPANNGLGASAGSIGAGTIQRDGVATDGVVGKFLAACNCMGGWTSPDGRTGQWEAATSYAGIPFMERDVYTGDVGFSGPAGNWTLSFSGVSGQPLAMPLSGDLPPVVAAWANIGPDWVQLTRFRPEFVLPAGPMGLAPGAAGPVLNRFR